MAIYRSEDFVGTDLAPRCYESHPALKLGKGTLYGGSASLPAMTKADVYVSLQSGSTSGLSSDPWDEQRVVEVYYAITDMQAPREALRFRKLVAWLCTQLQDGKTVHIGCIGGHGRTGMLMSALVVEMLGEEDAIGYVRKHYCSKAVESKAQVAYLVANFGVKDVAPAKEYKAPAQPPKWSYQDDEYEFVNIPPKRVSQPKRAKEEESRFIYKAKRVILPEGHAKAKAFSPIDASSRSVWTAGKKAKKTVN